MTSMITPANGNAAVIIDNWRRDHEFVIIDTAKLLMASMSMDGCSQSNSTAPVHRLATAPVKA